MMSGAWSVVTFTVCKKSPPPPVLTKLTTWPLTMPPLANAPPVPSGAVAVLPTKIAAGVFGRDAEGDARGDVNHSADLPLTDIIEPDHVVRVDRERDVLLARRHIDLVLCRQAPGLAGEDVKSPTSPTSVVIGEIGVSQARSPAVALVVIRCVADAQEVRLVKPGKLLVGIDVALDQQRDSALPGGAVKFVLVVKR